MTTRKTIGSSGVKGKKILLAVGGGIAAYKSVEVVRRLLKMGAEVRVIMTDSATRFVHPTTFSSITGFRVATNMFSEEGNVNVDHLALPHWADLFIIAPATANLIAKMAHGIADDLVSTAHLAALCPVLVAPAMNESMWMHPATQANISILEKRGVHQIGPNAGEMAAPGEKSGVGRMSEPVEIVDNIEEIFQPTGPLAGKKVLITAGRTEEKIDQVRIITNRSSGRMGVALANAALAMGAEVHLVHGPMDVNPPSEANEYAIRTAVEMHEKVLGLVKEMDMVIYAAAVADWRIKNPLEGKLKREGNAPPVLEFEPNPDIAGSTSHFCNGVTAGFALEMEQEQEAAVTKLKRKNLDAIFLNTVEAINNNNNQLEYIDKNGTTALSRNADKNTIAEWALKQLIQLMK